MEPPPDDARPPLRRLFTALGDTWRGLTVVSVIVAVGFGAGLALGGWYKMPTRLFLLEAHQAVADSVSRDLAQQLRAVRSLIKAQLCLTVAEKQHQDWSPCLVPSFQP